MIVGGLALSATAGFQFGVAYGLLTLAVLSVGAVTVAKIKDKGERKQMKRTRFDEFVDSMCQGVREEGFMAATNVSFELAYDMGEDMVLEGATCEVEENREG